MGQLISFIVPSAMTSLYVFFGLITSTFLLIGARRLDGKEIVFRHGIVSSLLQKRIMILSAGAAIGILALGLIGLIVGDYPIPAWKAITTAFWDRNTEYDFVINTLRFPRITVAVLAGICFATSGAIFQSLINNPLVSPDIIGVNNGAAVCAVILLATGGTVTYLPLAAFIGAVLASAIVYVLSWKRGVSGSRLVLVGIGFNALLGSVITFIQVRYPIERVMAAARWQAGSLFGSSWEDARTLSIGLAILLPSAFFLIHRLRLLQLGDEASVALGLSVERDRFALLTVGASLAAIAVAVIGPLGFVALLVPQIARTVVSTLTAGSLLFTGLLGGIFLLGADIVAQRLFAPVTLPAGIVTAAIGAPYFLLILVRYNRET